MKSQFEIVVANKESQIEELITKLKSKDEEIDSLNTKIEELEINGPTESPRVHHDK